MGLQGSIAAIVTPFTPDGAQINEAELRAHIDRQIAAGVDGILACGGTGEFTALSEAERRRVVEITVSQAAGRVAVVANTSGLSTGEAIRHTEHAKATGADAVMVATPYYDVPDFEHTREYYRLVAAATDLPVMLYHFPPGTHLRLTPEQMVQLADENPTVRYVKDSSQEPYILGKLVTQFRDRIGLFIGEEVLIPTAILLGATGLVSGAFNFVTPAYAAMIKAGRAGDDAKVVAIWRELLPFTMVVASLPYVAACKGVVEILGHEVGPVRSPGARLTADQRSELEAVIKATNPAFFA
jgi:4-hydroxy-tetrahydrodipicolinate synthase